MTSEEYRDRLNRPVLRSLNSCRRRDLGTGGNPGACAQAARKSPTSCTPHSSRSSSRGDPIPQADLSRPNKSARSLTEPSRDQAPLLQASRGVGAAQRTVLAKYAFGSSSRRRDLRQSPRPLVLPLSCHRHIGGVSGREAERNTRHGRCQSILPFRQDSHRHHAGSGHHGRPRQLPKGDPDRLARAFAIGPIAISTTELSRINRGIKGRYQPTRGFKSRPIRCEAAPSRGSILQAA